METLNASQLDALRRIALGENVFVTGAGGTGKSHLIDCFRQKLLQTVGGDDIQFSERYAFCGSTGVSASSIGGVTIHSALGLGVPTTRGDFVRNIAGNKAIRQRVRKWRVLVIDEISMVSGEFIDLAHEALCVARQGLPPLQWVMVGDFYQLPPIEDAQRVSTDQSLVSADPKRPFLNQGFAFESSAWSDHIRPFVCHLQEQFRQINDNRLSELLLRLRCAKDPEDIYTVANIIAAECKKTERFNDNIRPTRIFARNIDVDNVNNLELATLANKTMAKVYGIQGTDVVEPMIGTKLSEAERRNLLKNGDFFKRCLAPQALRLCPGAQVMLLKNLDVAKGLVNGTRGVVESIVNGKGCLVRFSETVAGGQPVLITGAKFACTVPHGNTNLTMTRHQIPLRLAWAMTVHKAQGMTLDRVHVSLCNMTAPGQVYVALSRARCLRGLSVDLPSDNRCIHSMCPSSPKVSEFYTSQQVTK